MSRARYVVGDARKVLATLGPGSVDCVITSPPYLQLRRYGDDSQEIGQEPTPGEFLGVLLDLMDDLWRVLSDDGTFWINLGDTHAGSGGAGGDYSEGGLREGQRRYDGTARKARANGERDSDRCRPARDRTRRPGEGWPLDQSVCFVPHLFGASLAYGRNLLTGEECRQWVVRPPVTWCKPNPMPGSTGRKFKSATELVLYGGKHQAHYWDVDPVREPSATDDSRRDEGPQRYEVPGQPARQTFRTSNENGKVPLNYWEIPTQPYEGAHFAVFPPELVVKPIIVGCPPKGTVLDPFAGSGTTLMVATGHDRNAIGIDLYEANADLARERCGMFLDVEHLDARVL